MLPVCIAEARVSRERCSQRWSQDSAGRLMLIVRGDPWMRIQCRSMAPATPCIPRVCRVTIRVYRQCSSTMIRYGVPCERLAACANVPTPCTLMCLLKP